MPCTTCDDVEPRTAFDADQAARIATLNDRLRRDRLGGHVVMTAAVAALPEETLNRLLLALRSFAAFTRANDPYGEHDFGRIACGGEDYLFKIDTFADASLTHGAEDPLAPSAVRVLTLMHASDY